MLPAQPIIAIIGTGSMGGVYADFFKRVIGLSLLIYGLIILRLSMKRIALRG